MTATAARAFRWYREPVVWLGTAVLATAIGGCISLIRTASRHVDADLPDPVDRRARMQVSAQRLSAALPPQARLARDGDHVVLRAHAATPASLQLLFWTTRAEHDLTIRLERQPDGSYTARLPALPPLAMHVRIDTPRRDDALVGEWPAGAAFAELREPAR
jgi:hypothetical protein